MVENCVTSSGKLSRSFRCKELKNQSSNAVDLRDAMLSTDSFRRQLKTRLLSKY